MNCRSAEPLLSAFIEDDLSQNERRSLEAHILACRRCSQTVRELRATLELVQTVPYYETSPHFEEDLLARIRSGEALRPTVVEWLRGVLEPARLRPLFLAGAGACAVWIGVMLVNPSVLQRANLARVPDVSPRTSAPAVSQPLEAGLAASKVDIASLAAPSAESSTAAARRRAGQTASSPSRGSTAPGAAIDESDWPVPPSTQQDAAISNPESRYDDQYITDQFFLEKDFGGSNNNNPTITPVSDHASDDVFITF